MKAHQLQLLHYSLNPKDIVYTSDWAAKDMVDFFQPSGKILEPCKGKGVFLKYLPKETEWCEISEGKDFFAWNKSVDWLVGNPPYSLFGKWMEHSLNISQNILYLLPLNKCFLSKNFMLRMKDWGRIKLMRFYGRGDDLFNYPLGFAAGAVLFQKDYFGPMELSYWEKQ